MKPHTMLALVAVTWALWPILQNAAQPVPTGPREVPSRLLPVPDTLSPQMQAIVARPFDPNYNLAPQTTAEWKKRIDEAARATLATLPKLRETLGVTVEPVTIA